MALQHRFNLDGGEINYKLIMAKHFKLLFPILLFTALALHFKMYPQVHDLVTQSTSQSLVTKPGDTSRQESARIFKNVKVSSNNYREDTSSNEDADTERPDDLRQESILEDLQTDEAQVDENIVIENNGPSSKFTNSEKFDRESDETSDKLAQENDANTKTDEMELVIPDPVTSGKDEVDEVLQVMEDPDTEDVHKEEGPDSSSSPELSFSKMDPKCDMDLRKEYLRNMCDENDLQNEELNWDDMIESMMIVDDRHQIVYCMIPKTATHSFRTVLGELAIGKIEQHMWYPLRNYLNHTGFRQLNKINGQEREKILANYYKFMVVRHPFSRLLSCYKNKMAQPGGLNEQVLGGTRAPIVDEFLRQTGRLSQDGQTFDPFNETLSLDEFLYLVGKKYEEGFIDEHWRRQYTMCKPCHINYDNIFRVETLDEDTQLFFDQLEKVGEKVDRQLEYANVDTFVFDPNEKLISATEAMRNIDQNVVKDLVQVYKEDFELFGYHWDLEKGATCKINLNDTVCC